MASSPVDENVANDHAARSCEVDIPTGSPNGAYRGAPDIDELALPDTVRPAAPNGALVSRRQRRPARAETDGVQRGPASSLDGASVGLETYDNPVGAHRPHALLGPQHVTQVKLSVARDAGETCG